MLVLIECKWWMVGLFIGNVFEWIWVCDCIHFYMVVRFAVAGQQRLENTQTIGQFWVILLKYLLFHVDNEILEIQRFVFGWNSLLKLQNWQRSANILMSSLKIHKPISISLEEIVEVYKLWLKDWFSALMWLSVCRYIFGMSLFPKAFIIFIEWL